MTRWLVGWSLRSRVFLLAVAAGVMIYGIGQLRSIPVDVLPEFTPPYVEIQTEALGLSAEEVEQLITVPMEQDLLIGLPWLESIHSESAPGMSSVVLVFQPGTDLMRARQMVAERMTQAVALPHVSKPPTILQPLSSTSRVMIVGLSSSSVSPIDMSVLARWTITPRLLGVPGVANVAIWGQRDWQLQVQMDPERMRAQGVSASQVLETTGNALWVSTLTFVEASTPGTGGFVETPSQRIGVRHVSPIISPEGLAQVPISDRKKADGTPLVLGDIANVVQSHQPLIGDAIANDGSTGLQLVIQKFPGANALEVTRGVESALAEMRPGLPGITVDTTVYRPATYVEESIDNLTRSLIVGAILLVLAIAVLSWSWRRALLSAVAIPLALVAAGFVLYLRGATMNVVVLVGLLAAVGVVVDDTIADTERIAQRLRRDREAGGDRPPALAVLAASVQTRSALFYATLIALAVVVPALALGGLPGSFLQPMVVSYALALLASMLVATTVTPALGLLLFGPSRGERRESPPLRRLRRGYESALSRTIRRPRLALAAVVVITLLGAAAVPFLGQGLMPGLKERDLLVQLSAMPGTSQPEMTRIVGLMARELRSIPGVRDTGAQVGRSVLGDQVVDVNSAQLWVNVEAAADYDQTVLAVRSAVAGYPGIRADVQTYLAKTTQDVFAPPSSSLAVRVYGDTDAALASQAETVRKSIADVAGIVGTRVDPPAQQLIVETEVDLSAAQRHGLKPGDVRRAVATLVSGIAVGQLFQDQKVFDVVVWGTPATRHSVDSVRNLLIDAPGGGQVRLGEVADVRLVPTASIIRHDSAKRYLDVVADVQGRDLGAVAVDVKDRVRGLQFPMEYHAEVLGDYSTHQATQARVLGLVAAALVGIFLLMQSAIRSWRLAGLAFLTIPSALAGGVIATLAVFGAVSVGSLAGLAAVAAIAVRASILLLSNYNHLQRHEGEDFGVALAIRGAGERLGSVVVSALATALALAPMLVLGDLPGLEAVRPLAIAVVGGLITTTLLSLFIIPALYLRLAVRAAPELELAPVTPLAERGVGETTLSEAA